MTPPKRKRAVTTSKKYPFENLSLKDMPGEIWKPVEGYENYYQVSNKGRVKSLDRWLEYDIPGKHTVRFTKAGRILRQGLRKQWNATVKEYSYLLSVTFCVDQVMDTHIVGRLVYHAFVDKIDFSKDGHYISHKDGMLLNNQVKNLQVTDRSAIGKRVFLENRGTYHFKGMDMTPFIASRSKKLHKPITQYDMKGRRVKIYDSVKAASESTGAHASNIALSAKQKKLSAAGYIWRYGKGQKRIETAALLQEKMQNMRKTCRVVSQYDLRGTRLRIFQSMAEAARATDTFASAIHKASSGLYLSAGGFIWRYGEGDKKIDVQDQVKRIANRSLGRSKSVTKCSMDGKPLKTYSSMAEAARALHCSADTISLAARKDRSCRGYRWKFM